jgi:undecaprenyl-diphosphatase
MQDINKCSLTFKLLIKTIDPFTKFFSHGATLILGSLFVCLLARSFGEKKLYQASRSLFIGLISSGIIVQVLKHLIGRARPRITYENVFIGPSIKGGYDSFPSGHTTLAFCLAFILTEYYPRYKFIFYTFAFMVCLHRLEGPAHFPTDILAGALLGIIVGKSFAGAHNHGEDWKPRTA